MNLFKEFEGKKTGGRVNMFCDKGTIIEVIDDGFHELGKTAASYWVKWDDYRPSCVSFDHDGNWIH